MQPEEYGMRRDETIDRSICSASGAVLNGLLTERGSPPRLSYSWPHHHQHCRLQGWVAAKHGGPHTSLCNGLRRFPE